MPKFETIKTGDRLWDVRKGRFGEIGNYPVDVVSVDAEKRAAECRWNGNPPRTYRERSLAKLRRTPKKGKQ